MGQEKSDVNAKECLDRLPIETTAYYTVNRAPEGFSKPPSLLLVLHGWGQDCRSFARVFRKLRNANVLVVAQQAPHLLYLDSSRKKVGFSWLTRYEKFQSINDLNAYFERLLAALQDKYVYDSKEIYLLGFSQGSSIAYRFAVSGRVPVAGVISCCADLPPDVAEVLPSTTPFPVLLGYAEEDAMVNPNLSRDAEAKLRNGGFACEVYPYPGSHRVSSEFVTRLGDWIKAVRPRKSED
jgi:phospholipase/carboxylesterase